MTTTPTADTGRAPRDRTRALVLRYPLITFFGLTHGISRLARLPYVLPNGGFGILDFRHPDLIVGDQPTAILPGTYPGPPAAASTVTATTVGREGLRRWRRHLFQVRAGLRWYALALLGGPFAVVIGTLAPPDGEEAIRLSSTMVLLVCVPVLVLQFSTTGLAEEPGRRDFALSRLQHRHHPLPHHRVDTVGRGPSAVSRWHARSPGFRACHHWSPSGPARSSEEQSP